MMTPARLSNPRALRQLRRILVPGGRLLFIEHVASDESGLRRWQDRMHWLNRIVGHGCECNRATLDSILAAGFSVSDLRRDTPPRVPAIVRPFLIGCAESTKQPRPQPDPARPPDRAPTKLQSRVQFRSVAVDTAPPGHRARGPAASAVKGAPGGAFGSALRQTA